MAPPLFLIAASAAAASLTLSPDASVHAFNLQLKTSRAAALPAFVSPSTAVFNGPPGGPSAPLTTAGPPPVPASELRLHAATSPPGGDASTSTAADNSVLAMAAFLRCHKPLLNDRGPELPDGNLCMLLRGCDAHQRMISPLELKTNAEALPGAAAAGVMAAKGTGAAEVLCEQLGESLKLSKGPHGVCPVELLKLEVGKVHRLLQYATAAGLKKNFLSSDALLVMLELYEREMDEKSFNTFFLPAYDEVLAKFSDAKKLVKPAEKVPFSSLPYEPTPDPRTLTPLVVDIMQFKDKLHLPTGGASEGDVLKLSFEEAVCQTSPQEAQTRKYVHLLHPVLRRSVLVLQQSFAVMERGEQQDHLVVSAVQRKYTFCAQADPSTSTAADGPEIILQACRGPVPAEYTKVGITRTYSDLDISQETAGKHAEDMGVEVASGVSSGQQFQLYAILLVIGVLAALALRKLKALSYRWTSYPTLLASLLTAAAAWGLVDVAIEVAAGEDKARRLLYYFFGFLAAGFLVALHVALIDRGFSKVVEGFI
ncbi:LOW QUALITY PROTEIN: uncharacterized protein EMH_0013330 [Eimeria mitis]|uniref:Dolichyl-diphosphooligosaccharide--protein glycosyltransferase subunit 2 n=1 Tax=Eimeria mitis TaxID=44415 RepID=U6K769_9EIME|nr:LOW QUALITY PROTEIN: uncharacterized protein EMH_0013330 [Eimeria mitis]CDJ32686.1 hypothetical protein, conserved [Eimeria mitis]